MKVAVPKNIDMHIVHNVVAIGVFTILHTDFCCHLEVPVMTALDKSIVLLISDVLAHLFIILYSFSKICLIEFNTIK